MSDTPGRSGMGTATGTNDERDLLGPADSAPRLSGSYGGRCCDCRCSATGSIGSRVGTAVIRNLLGMDFVGRVLTGHCVAG